MSQPQIGKHPEWVWMIWFPVPLWHRRTNKTARPFSPSWRSLQLMAIDLASEAHHWPVRFSDLYASQILNPFYRMCFSSAHPLLGWLEAQFARASDKALHNLAHAKRDLDLPFSFFCPMDSHWSCHLVPFGIHLGNRKYLLDFCPRKPKRRALPDDPADLESLADIDACPQQDMGYFIIPHSVLGICPCYHF